MDRFQLEECGDSESDYCRMRSRLRVGYCGSYPMTQTLCRRNGWVYVDHREENERMGGRMGNRDDPD
jgi:hypothetical protein